MTRRARVRQREAKQRTFSGGGGVALVAQQAYMERICGWMPHGVEQRCYFGAEGAGVILEERGTLYGEARYRPRRLYPPRLLLLQQHRRPESHSTVSQPHERRSGRSGFCERGSAHVEGSMRGGGCTSTPIGEAPVVINVVHQAVEVIRLEELVLQVDQRGAFLARVVGRRGASRVEPSPREVARQEYDRQHLPPTPTAAATRQTLAGRFAPTSCADSERCA